MQFHCVLLLVAFIQAAIAFLESDSLEESVTLKFGVASKLRKNLSKILNRLPTKDYEVAQSIRLLQDFFNNGGSLLDSLEKLPVLAHISTNEQIDGIFFSMEDHVPRFLLPAVSVLRKFLASESLEIYESLRSGNDTLIVDPFDEVSLTDLRKAGMSINLPSRLKSSRHLWPDLVGATTTAIITGLLKPSGKLLGCILSNVMIQAEDPWTKEAILMLINKFSTMEKQLEHFEWTLNPYNLLQRALLAVAEDNSTMDAVRRIFPLLKLSEDLSTSDLSGFVNNSTINFTLLVLNDSTLGNTEEGRLLLSAIENGDLDIKGILHGFQIFDYSEPKKLLIAVISRLRRHRPRLSSGLGDTIENCYSKIMGQYNHDNWQKVPRNPTVIKSIIQGMKSDDKTPRVNRLIGDIKASLEQSVSLTSWHKSLAYIKETECYGPSCLVLRTLQGLQDARVIQNHALRSAIVEFLDISRQNDTYKCSDLSTMNYIYESYEKRPKNLNLTNILQALPKLEIDSKEYKLLRETLSQKNLEQILGAKINVTEHPTRAKMLSWILQRLENQDSANKNIRKLATKFVTEISYEGYGAVKVDA